MRISSQKCSNYLLVPIVFSLLSASQMDFSNIENVTSRELVFSGIVYGYLDDHQSEFAVLAGAHVEVMVNGGATFYAETWCDDSGSFLFEVHYPDGPWPFFHEAQAVVTMDSYYQQETTIDFGSWPVYLDFYLDPLETEEIFLFGTVVTPTDPEGDFVPVSEALIEIFDEISGDFLAEFITGESGYFEFGNIAYEAGLISVTAEGFLYQEFPLPGYSEDPIELDFILEPEPDPSDFGWITGDVTTRLTSEGNLYQLAFVSISATPAWGDPILLETITDESGHYQLDIPISEIPWLIACTTIFGEQSQEILIDMQSEFVMDFHFDAWEYPPLPPPLALSAQLSEDETQVWLTWAAPAEWPLFCEPLYEISSNVMNDPNQDWHVIGETEDLNWEDFPEPPEGLPIDVCYRITAFCEEKPSSAGNIACVQSWEPAFPPAPNGLTAMYSSEPDPSGSVLLDWYYPIIPEPELTPQFQVFAHLGEHSEDEFIFVGETELHHFVYYFDELVDPEPVNCFRVNAIIGEESSEYSNTVCIVLEEEQPGEFLIYGNVFQAGDEPEMISGAGIQAYDIMTADEYETTSDEQGHYELIVEPGEFIITCMVVDELLQQHHLILENEAGLHLDFWIGEFPESHPVTGLVYGLAATGDLLPLTGAELMSVQDGLIFYSSTDAGHYSMDLPWTGNWLFTVMADGFESTIMNIWLEENAEQDFILNPLEDLYPVWLNAGSTTGVPGGIVEIPLTIENLEPVRNIAFTLQDDPSMLTLVDMIMHLDCFVSGVDDDDQGASGWMYGLDNCVLDPGTTPFATMVYQVEEFAEFGEVINLSFSDVTVLDAFENWMYVIADDGALSLELLGDVNEDGDWDVLDIVLLINFVLVISDPDEYQFWAADVNSDGQLDVLDIVQLVDMILNG